MYDYIIPYAYTYAIIYDDYTSLTDAEVNEVKEFLDNLSEQFGPYSVALFDNNEEPEFRPFNDVNNLGSDCVKIVINHR